MPVGLLGGGGSILAVPALVYLAGQDLQQAVATSLLGIWVIPAFGWQWMFVLGALPALVLAPLLSRYLPDDVPVVAPAGATARPAASSLPTPPCAATP